MTKLVFKISALLSGLLLSAAAIAGPGGSGGPSIVVGPDFSYNCKAKVQQTAARELINGVWDIPTYEEAFVLSNGSGFVRKDDFSVQASVTPLESGAFMTSLYLSINANDALGSAVTGATSSIRSNSSAIFSANQEQLRIEGSLPIVVMSKPGVSTQLSNKIVVVNCTIQKLDK